MVENTAMKGWLLTRRPAAVVLHQGESVGLAAIAESVLAIDASWPSPIRAGPAWKRRGVAATRESRDSVRAQTSTTGASITDKGVSFNGSHFDEGERSTRDKEAAAAGRSPDLAKVRNVERDCP